MPPIYMDNAATSWPKPPEVLNAMAACLSEAGANPGRAGHGAANAAARIVYDTREAVAGLFNAPDPLRVVFGANVTWSLNLVLQGMLSPGGHMVTTSVEHNSVMRPLRALEQRGVEVTVVRCARDGTLDPDDLMREVRDDTRLVVMTQASNVLGTILPVADIGCRLQSHNALLLVDTAQSAGAIPIDMQRDGIDLLAFTGHKSLFGPMGTGGLVVGSRVDVSGIRPLAYGGTGSRSEEEHQPEFLPDRFESGTPNVVGLAGLRAGIAWVNERGVEAIRAEETALAGRLLEGLMAIDGVTVHGPASEHSRVAVVSFTMDSMDPSEAGLELEDCAGVLCRTGLHCSPSCHTTAGTFPDGTVRLSLGPGNTADDVDTVVTALRDLASTP